MHKFISKLVASRGNKSSGFIAFTIVALIALGCTCGKELGLGGSTDTSHNSSQTASNAFDDNTTTAPSRPTYIKVDASKGEMPTDAELQDLVKKTLLDFDSALQKEDFTEFHSKLCKPWQKQTTPESLKTSFQAFIDKGISLKSIGPLEAEFSKTPEIGKELGFKTLKLEGKYDTSPNATKFELNYIPDGKDWKLSKIVVDTTSRV